MKKIYNDIYNWVKHPDEVSLNLQTGEKIKMVSKILLLELLFALPFLGLIYLIDLYILKLEMPLDDSHPILIFTFVVFIAPVLEEFIFRFPLKYRRNYLARLISFLSKGWLIKRWNSIFKYFLYLSVIVFGLIHLPNFNNSETLFFILSPVIIGSQLIGGFLLSYSRIKLGFVWSFFQHSAFNLVFLGLWIFFSHNQTIAEESNESFSIKIVEKAYVNKHNSYYKSKSNKDTVFYIDAMDISLANFIDSLNIKDFKRFEDRWVDVKINSVNGMTRKELESFLKEKILSEQ